MKKLITASALLSSIVLPSANAAESFNEAIKNATTSGQFRLGYISVSPDVAGFQTTSAAAVGGYIKIETAKWNRMQFAIAPYFSEKVEALSGDKAQGKLNGEFFDSNSESYAYLGEAYVNYAFSNGSVRFGRQQLDNPFINTDDIRMHPNTFSAAWLNMSLSDNVTLDVGRVSEWAGFDSGGSQDKFKEAGVDGVTALGLTYKMKEHHTFQGWYYDFNDQYSQYYFDAAYENGNFNAGLQYSQYNEVKTSGIEGSVWGAIASYALGDFTLAASINESSNETDKSQNLGLGGGNFFAAMDEMTIGGLTDASAQVFSVEYAASDKFSAILASGNFEDKNKATTDISETDLILSYSFNEQFGFEFIHSVVDNKAAPADAGSNFSRQLARLSYNF